MTEDDRRIFIDGFRSISIQLASGTWEYGYTLVGDISEYAGFIRMWKTPDYNGGTMHWNMRNVLRFGLSKPMMMDLVSWRRSLGDFDD